ncbi:MAG TPA: hypothetical protein VJB91_00505 [Patescibacteria group bacterium]|nr:hypothetical protein [Patescibacteria group bacterium]
MRKNNRPRFSPASFGRILFGLFFVLASLYILLPQPNIEPIPFGVRSNLEGDTWQIKGISAFFTNASRDEVISYYKTQMGRTAFLNLQMPLVRLNHPPEYAKTAISDQTKSNYFEEFVQPFRGSLYVNGWEPLQDPFKYRLKSPPVNHLYKGQEYTAKVTVLYVGPGAFGRYVFFLLTLLGTYLVLSQIKLVFTQKWFQREK